MSDQDSKSQFVKPECVLKDVATATPTYSRFTAQPFESGYAQTVGNALRRVLLSSCEGVAITAIKLKGASHEFMSLPGITEDVTDIVIALKQVLIATKDYIPELITIRKVGPCTVTAGDFEESNAGISIVNKDLVIATVAEGGEFELEASIAKGRGFHQAQWNKSKDHELGVIPIDSIFSPVSRVNYIINPKRLGNRTDYEELVLDVWTDGRITPDEALRSGAELIRSHFDYFVNFSDLPPVVEEENKSSESSDLSAIRRLLATNVNEIELSVRAANCLNNANITTVGELVCRTEEDMLNYRNFGKKSLNEIKDKLQELNLSLGANLPDEILEPYREIIKTKEAQNPPQVEDSPAE